MEEQVVNGSSYHPASSLLANQPLVAAFLASVIAQVLKVLIAWYKDKRWDARKLLGSGGMPSSHSASVTGLAIGIGLKDGMGSSLFAVSLILACVVMYDATGVRLHAGRQAEVHIYVCKYLGSKWDAEEYSAKSTTIVLNQIVIDLPPDHPLYDCRPLRERLGHTPLQVMAGAFLGFFVAYFVFLVSGGYS